MADNDIDGKYDRQNDRPKTREPVNPAAHRNRSGTGNPGIGNREPGHPPKSARHFHKILQYQLGPLQCKH
eukprot:1316157-Pyramimonas_sp.AAC.1